MRFGEACWGCMTLGEDGGGLERIGEKGIG